MENCIGDSFSCPIMPSFSPRADLSLQVLVSSFILGHFYIFVLILFRNYLTLMFAKAVPGGLM